MMEKAETQTCNDLKHRRSGSNKKTGTDDDDRGEWPELRDLLTKANANMVWVGYGTKDQCGGYAPGNDAMAAYTKFVHSQGFGRVYLRQPCLELPHEPSSKLVRVSGHQSVLRSSGAFGGLRCLEGLSVVQDTGPKPLNLKLREGGLERRGGRGGGGGGVT